MSLNVHNQFLSAKNLRVILLLLFSSLLIIVYSQNNSYCDYCANTCDDGPNFNYWIVEEKLISPDNYLQVGKVINGQFPGPTIRISPHEYLVVKVENRLSVGLSIHWHGIHQEHTIESDGADMITQNEIPTNGTYTYCMHIGVQVGTHMYHAHSRLDIIFIQGALIIEDPENTLDGDFHNYFYTEDRIIILGQLYHFPLSQYFQQLLTANPRPSTDSLLINGKSYGEWPDSNANNSEGYDVIHVQKGVTYRFRVINISSDQFLQFSITNHRMRVIEADGIYISPIDVDYLVMHAAQRYSVIITMDQDINNYWIESKSIGEDGPGNGAAILHYESSPDPTSLRTIVKNLTIDGLPVNEWITPYIYPNPKLYQPSIYPIPLYVDRSIYIDFHLLLIPPIARFAINGHVFQNPQEPYLAQVRNGQNITSEPQVYEIIEGQRIQVILQSRAIGQTSICEVHPWHFHGRSFYVVARGPDEFDPARDVPLINQAVLESNGHQFQFRDVFIQFPHQTITNNTPGAACGWYAIRFLANNPGIWLSHCHYAIYDHWENNAGILLSNCRITPHRYLVITLSYYTTYDNWEDVCDLGTFETEPYATGRIEIYFYLT